MKINFTKKQYEDLVTMSQLSGWVLGILGDTIPDDDGRYKKMSNEHGKLESYLLSFADEYGLGGVVERFNDELTLDDDETEKYGEIMDDFEEFVFWDNLENRMARRDFYRTISEEERKEADKTGWLPERFRDIEEKYRKEFDENGVDNLEVKKLE